MLDDFRIRLQQVNGLLQTHKIVLDEELSKSLLFVGYSGYDVYRLQEERVLLMATSNSQVDKPDDSMTPKVIDAFLFPSLDILLEQRRLHEEEIKQLAKERANDPSLRCYKGAHVLEGRLPRGRNFPDVVDILIQQLPALLNIDELQFDVSWANLRVVDEAARQVGYDRCLKNPVFAHVVAYVGELMKQEVHGRWDMVWNISHDVWEPYIVDPNGHSLNPWLKISKILLEGEQGSSNALEAVARYEIDNAKRKTF